METIKAQVHLIATDKLAAENKEGRCLFFNSKGQLIHYIQSISAAPIQHLYFTTDEEIKGWCIYIPTGEIYYQQYGNNAMYDKPNGKLQSIITNPSAFRKIVATTNPDLWSYDYSEQIPGRPPKVNQIPKIDIPFIEAYIKAYNEGAPIKEVMLETKERNVYNCIANHCICEPFNKDCINVVHLTESRNKLKLKPNGSVITHAIKQLLYPKPNLRDLLLLAQSFSNGPWVKVMDVVDWYNKSFPK